MLFCYLQVQTMTFNYVLIWVIVANYRGMVAFYTGQTNCNETNTLGIWVLENVF